MIAPTSVTAVLPAGYVSAAPTTNKPASGGGEGFGDAVTNALKSLDNAHKAADAKAVEAATGDLESVTDYVVAATEAQLMTELTVAVRDRAVQAFNDVMRMQV